MIDELDRIAAEYILGIGREERSTLELRLRDEEPFLTRVIMWEQLLTDALDVNAAVSPPDSLWRGVERRIAGHSIPRTLTVRHDPSGWARVSPGVEKKHLAMDEQFETSLLRLGPGARIPAHDHHAPEECFVLDGSLSIGALTLETGDYHCAHSGSHHPEAYSPTGAIVYLRAPILELEANHV